MKRISILVVIAALIVVGCSDSSGGPRPIVVKASDIPSEEGVLYLNIGYGWDASLIPDWGKCLSSEIKEFDTGDGLSISEFDEHKILFNTDIIQFGYRLTPSERQAPGDIKYYVGRKVKFSILEAWHYGIVTPPVLRACRSGSINKSDYGEAGYIYLEFPVPDSIRGAFVFQVGENVVYLQHQSRFQKTRYKEVAGGPGIPTTPAHHTDIGYGWDVNLGVGWQDLYATFISPGLSLGSISIDNFNQRRVFFNADTIRFGYWLTLSDEPEKIAEAVPGFRLIVLERKRDWGGSYCYAVVSVISPVDKSDYDAGYVYLEFPVPSSQEGIFILRSTSIMMKDFIFCLQRR